MALHDQERDVDETLDDGDELREAFAEFAANLVTTLENVFLTALFASRPGQWLEVFEFCDDQAAARLEPLEAAAEDSPLLVSWIDYVVEGLEEDYASGFCTITFFIESLMWSYTAIYNRALFLEQHAAQ